MAAREVDDDVDDVDEAPHVTASYPPVENKKVRPPGPIKFATHFLNTLRDALKGLDWVQVGENDDWDLHWAGVGWVKEQYDHVQAQLPDYVRICHYRNHYELTRKDLVVKNMKRFMKQLEKEKGRDAILSRCSFLPTTFSLPVEYRMFVEEFKRNTDTIWIMKPCARAQGKGIFLFNKLSEIMEWKKDQRFDDRRPQNQQEEQQDDTVEEYIVQRYIANPYLVGGKKFDMRIYCLITSWRPLKAYLYRSAFARFAGVPFSMDDDAITNNVVHLTNVAVQKTAEGYDPKKGSKWQMFQLKRYMLSRHDEASVQKLFDGIDNIILTTIQSVQPVMINDKHCFEIYGYDVLIDDNLKPWLMEVNASPSLTADTSIDYCLKMGLLEDAMAIIDLEKIRGGNEKRVGGFDMFWNDGPIYRDSPLSPSDSTSDQQQQQQQQQQPLNTYLGCYNDDRQQQLFNLWHQNIASKTPFSS